MYHGVGTRMVEKLCCHVWAQSVSSVPCHSSIKHLQVRLVHWDHWRKNRVWQNLWSRCGRQSTTEQYESTVYMWAIEALTIPVHLWAQEHIQQNPARLWSIGKTLGGSMHRRINWQFPRLELLPLPLLLFLSPKDLQSYSPKSWGFFTKGQKVRFAPLCGKGTERKVWSSGSRKITQGALVGSYNIMQTGFCCIHTK